MAHDGSRAAAQQDTTPKALAHCLERVRNTPPRERLARAFALSNRARTATMSDVERSMPGASRNQVAVAFVRRVYGEALAAQLEKRFSGR